MINFTENNFIRRLMNTNNNSMTKKLNQNRLKYT